MKKLANDILDTCKNNTAKFSGFVVSKLIKKNCLHYFTNTIMVFVLCICTSFNPDTFRPYGLTKVVIDAGHGGHDPGCLGKKSKEKDIALEISLKLGKYIEEHFPDVKVIYTRETDKFIELYERAEIANNAKADLFISIHCNSACFFDKKKKKEICSAGISGVESWVMGLNKSEANLEVAKRENEVILLEKDYTRQYGGFDPNSPGANIIFTLYQNTYLDQSLRMASYVQQEMKVSGRPLRGVKQAGFLVLYKTSMPSILIETGFLSNAVEEKYLLSSKGQAEMSKAIFRAFKSYKNSIESQRNGQEVPLPNDSPVTKKSIDEKPDSIIKIFPDSIKKDSVKTVIHKTEAKPIESDTNLPLEHVLQWSVQFFTAPKPIPDNHKIYSNFDDVREDYENGVYKYSIGLLRDKNESIKIQSKFRLQGYSDAFVVAFLNNKKISIKEAGEKSIKK